LGNVIAWLGILLGIATGVAFTVLWLRHSNTLKRRASETQSASPVTGLYLSGSEFETPTETHSAQASPEPTPQTPIVTEPVSPAARRQGMKNLGGLLAKISRSRREKNQAAKQDKKSTSLSDKLRTPMGLQGTLTQVPVHDFLQFLAQGNRTGVLEVVSGRRHGFMRLKDGHIVFASFRGRYGLAALYAMLPLNEGDFEFIEGSEAAPPSHVEGGPPHEPMDVVDVLLQWEVKRRNENQA
jgi:Domain of unknown function (DUF4388)